MDFSTGISAYNTNYNLNAIDDYNKFLQGNASFDVENNVPDFESVLQKASADIPLRDKYDPVGLGNFMNQIGGAFENSLNTVNDLRLDADRKQEDLAMGGSTSIHDAMIAAEKASLSMQMAIQVRNRLVTAYTDITSMAI